MLMLIHTKRFPPKGFHAITLFPFVFYRGKELMDSEKRHESVHLWQQVTLLIIPFYILYFIFWLYYLVKYRDKDRAYRAIPFEVSAYRLESQTDLKWYEKAFDWLRQ